MRGKDVLDVIDPFLEEQSEEHAILAKPVLPGKVLFGHLTV
jgi:hypothetical protein